MRIAALEKTLICLTELIRQGRFEELETDTLEIKPVPADATGWRERYKTACAFLNTRGGIIIYGVKEEGTGPARKYVFTGWQPHAEPNIKECAKQFTERDGRALDLSESFPPPEIRDFMGGKIAIQLIDELSADRKYVFYRGEAYRRILTGDHRLNEDEIEKQEAFREEALQAKELQLLPELTEADLDLAKLNQFIFQLNQPVPIETMKADIAQARPFLERRCFIKEGRVSVLGALVCAQHPGDHLGFRSHLHGYVDVPQQVAQDKQDFVDNVLQLMESGLGYLLRNIQVGVSASQGGTSQPQYPEQLLRETVNNALAHRDYGINRQVIVAIKPGEYISLRNPGTFRKRLLIESVDTTIPLLRVLPEAKPRNPKLADILRVFRKWEGRGIGMATMVNLCLQNEIDLPQYRFGTEDVTLFLRAGKLLDGRMERLFQVFNRYISDKLQGNEITTEQKLVLAYLIKSEWANQQVQHTILLTPDNNHFKELLRLEQATLIQKHQLSTAMYPIYVADRILMRKDYIPELHTRFGLDFDALDSLLKDVLGVVYRHNHYSKQQVVSAKMASFNLWEERGGATGDIMGFDAFYRKVRYAFNKLEKGGFVQKRSGTRGYLLTDHGATDVLRPVQT